MWCNARTSDDNRPVTGLPCQYSDCLTTQGHHVNGQVSQSSPPPPSLPPKGLSPPVNKILKEDIKDSSPQCPSAHENQMEIGVKSLSSSDPTLYCLRNESPSHNETIEGKHGNSSSLEMPKCHKERENYYKSPENTGSKYQSVFSTTATSKSDQISKHLSSKSERTKQGERFTNKRPGESPKVITETEEMTRTHQLKQNNSPKEFVAFHQHHQMPLKQQHQQPTLAHTHQITKQPVREANVAVGLKSQNIREPIKLAMGVSGEGRINSRERLSSNGQQNISQREYPRQDFYRKKVQEQTVKPPDLSPKPLEFTTASPLQTQDYPNKISEIFSKPQDFPNKLQDYPNVLGAPSSPVYKPQNRDISLNQHQSHIALMSTSQSASNMRNQVASPARVTSPPIKLANTQRMSSPPVKMVDHRLQSKEYSIADNHLENSGISKATTSPYFVSNHFVHQYPERDNSVNPSNGGQAWEGGYIFMSGKCNSGTNSPYSPLSPMGVLQQQILPPRNSSQEKAIDALDFKEHNFTKNQQILAIENSKNKSRLSPLGSDSLREDKFAEYPPEKDDGDSEVTVDGFDLKKLAEVTSKMTLTVLPDDVDTFNDLNKKHLNNHVSHLNSHSEQMGGHITPESTDCGSLSKSSSDGDHHLINRKRPPTKLKSKRRNILSFPHHLSVDELRGIQRRDETYHGTESSSDENRSSGHASMSDSHTSSSPPVDTLPRHHHHRANLKAVPEDDRLSVAVTSNGSSGAFGLHSTVGNRRGVSRPRHRNNQKDDFSFSLESASGLEDIKQAIEHLTMRSQGSRTSYSTSTYSSMSGSEGEPIRRLMRHSSLETINTNITSADEFVWVDSHNRLVELQQLPWSNHDVLRVIQQGRVREQLDRVSMEAVPRLSYLLQRALVRIAREAQRLTKSLAMCSKREVSSAFRVVLSPALADSCIKACLRAATMFTVSGDHLRQGKSARAGLNLSVSRFMRWMCDVRLGKFIHEYAGVYLTGGMENLLEEIILQCLPEGDQLLTATALEHAIANNGDLWGLLQPYAHLNAGRTATGALSLPRWASGSSSDRSSLNDSIGTESGLGSGSGSPGSICLGSGSAGNSSGGSISEGSCSTSSCGINTPGSQCSSSLTLTSDEQTRNLKARLCGQTLEQTLLTTCVGSLVELSELVTRVAPHLHKVTNINPPTPHKSLVTWSPSALHALFYFMRCSQLEHAEHSSRAPIQELVYERPYIVLPPLVEWVRVATAHTEHRHSTVVDKDDVMQASRLLLPGVDCPVRMIGYEELMCPRRNLDEAECAKKFKIDLAFKMLSCSRTDLVPHALQLLPTTKVNTVNEYGVTPLMLACIRGDETMVQMLLDSGADVDAETPPTGPSYLMANPETQHWTALTYASIHGHIGIAKILLEKKANEEGGARQSEEKCTETPLQVAAAAGHLEMMSLLLSYGANPYLSTLMKDSLSYSGAAQRGCYAAIAVAAAHGQRSALHKLLSQPQQASSREVLSLEEILAEGASNHTSDRERRSLVSHSPEEALARGSYVAGPSDSPQLVKLTKHQIKTLQEAMYHSAECGHLEMTLDLRNLGVPWTLLCWMHTLATAHEHRLESIIDQLLQDFLQDWPEDYSTQFVDECLPLLFTIFRYSKNEGTSLLLADIFSTCYGKEPIKDIRDTSISAGARIDPKFVNNPELSDVQFRVEGRVFYAHKIILVNASTRFKQMLNSKVCEGNPPIVQIHDIRYDIFELVMQSLYKGGCENLEIEAADVLELMAAANFFQLDNLLRYCEARCSKLVNVENVVSMYVHAKVYGAMQLLEFCQGFLLQNMVALLTYDDSVRRLIFGKKLHNHDVLSGLLLTLQARINDRALPRAGK